jgi:magnesium transporter
MLRAAYLQPDHPPLLLESAQKIKELLALTDGFLWVSLETATDTEINEILRDVFQFHPLAIEDCQSPGFQVAKIDDFSEYIFIITHALNFQAEDEDQTTRELDLFLGNNFVVTCYSDPQMPAIVKTWDQIQKDGRIARFGPDFLCHTILDNIVDEYLPILDTMESEVEWLEDSVIEKPTPETLHRLLRIKHQIMALRRIISPQREVMNRLSRDEFPGIIDAQSLIYFRDIYDHLVRFQDLADVLRDIVSGALDIYLNSTSLRLNEIMKALTIVSTVFLPLSFITGAFGMNFLHIPGASSQLGFYITCALLIVLGALMLFYFKKRRWF